MVLKALCDYLDREQIRYTVISHSPAFTAQEIAAASHISGREIAKSVIVRIDGELAMAVLPASRHVDVELLGELTGSIRIEMAHEADFHDCFPGCETGAMPPFGNLYGMPVYVADELTVALIEHKVTQAGRRRLGRGPLLVDRVELLPGEARTGGEPGRGDCSKH